MNHTETQSFSTISRLDTPKNILIIRFHAIGDVSITLPACASLRAQFPSARIDFLTSEHAVPLLESLETFNNIHTPGNIRNSLSRAIHAITIAAKLRAYGYDTVIDLQRNWMSKLIRHLLRPKYWGEFDRFTLRLAVERTLETFHHTGFTQTSLSFKPQIKRDVLSNGLGILVRYGWDEHTPLIILNPAGLWETRNWPIENYVTFANLWLKHDRAQFLILGTQQISSRSARLKESLGNSLINLVGKTTLSEAFAILQFASLMISEDSGLMHMAWVSGIPTVALFGSTQHQWSAPFGDHTRCLHSGDLECASCMQPSCRFGDVHCLTRYSPSLVLEHATELLAGQRKAVHTT